MKPITFLFSVRLLWVAMAPVVLFSTPGCLGRGDPSNLKYGRDVEAPKLYWKDGKGHHFVGLADNQSSLEAGRRLAVLMANRAVSEKIGTTLRAETSARFEASGAGAEQTDRFLSDVTSQVSQNLLSGITPERSWHQEAKSAKGKAFRCYHQVMISDGDLDASIERAKQTAMGNAPNENIRNQTRNALDKLKDSMGKT